MSETNHEPVWMRTFTEEQRSEQLQDDADAWHGIIGILLAIVALGSSSAAVVVWAIAKFS